MTQDLCDLESYKVPCSADAKGGSGISRDLPDVLDCAVLGSMIAGQQVFVSTLQTSGLFCVGSDPHSSSFLMGVLN